MPTSAPTNIRISNLQPGELKVEWDPIPQHAANGRLLGYRVYYIDVYDWNNWGNVTSPPHVPMVVIRNLKQGQLYTIFIAAFTSKGVGAFSQWILFTTGITFIGSL